MLRALFFRSRLFILVTLLGAAMLPALPARSLDPVFDASSPVILPVPKNLTAIANNKGILLRWDYISDPSFQNFKIFRYDTADVNRTVKNIAVVPKPRKASPLVSYFDSAALSKHKYVYFLTTADLFGNQSSNSKIAWARMN